MLELLAENLRQAALASFRQARLLEREEDARKPRAARLACTAATAEGDADRDAAAPSPAASAARGNAVAFANAARVAARRSVWRAAWNIGECLRAEVQWSPRRGRFPGFCSGRPPLADGRRIISEIAKSKNKE